MFKQGYIQRLPYMEGNAIYIGDEPLAELLELFHRRSVYVCFAFDERKITPERLIDIAIQSAVGPVDARLKACYSEITGFLYVDEDATIGGHDLIEIFENHLEEFGAIIISMCPIDLSDPDSWSKE